MEKTKICILGHFGEGLNLLNGQTVKTKIVTTELCNVYGEENIKKIDTHGGVKTLIKSPIQVLKAMKSSENVVIFPAHNGLRIYAPLLSFFKRFFKKTKLHYAVIGGWLPEFLKGKKGLAKSLKNFDGIYVETKHMKDALASSGFTNVFVMPNCKQLAILDRTELRTDYTIPYKLCTFSRVMKEKGIEDAVNAVRLINEKLGSTIFTLDIYGQVDSAQTEWFDDLKRNFPEYITYGGLVPFDKSVDVLKEYFALLFPTLFIGEGVPGTFIDAFAAGVPVISSEFANSRELIDDKTNGLIFEFANFEKLCKTLESVANEPNIIISMKKHCINEAQNYLPEKALLPLIDNI